MVETLPAGLYPESVLRWLWQDLNVSLDGGRVLLLRRCNYPTTWLQP